MSATGLDVFDRTLQITNTWLDEVMETLGPDRKIAWHALGAVLRALRDQLTLGLTAHFGAQLPLLVRGLYYDQWRPSEQPQKLRTADEFLARVGQDLANIRPVNVRDATQAVFRVLNHHVEPNQVGNVREALAKPIRALWPETNVEGRRGVESAA
jgi:uncharacterized protein (DUF2267 family)